MTEQSEKPLETQLNLLKLQIEAKQATLDKPFITLSTLATPATLDTPTQAHQHRSVIEGSEFLAYASRADTPTQAREQLEQCKSEHANATHHCWAYQIGREYRFHDDGEPSSTAGVPIWRAIEGQNLDHVMLIVVRYFGGVKLGTGGLARAYGGCAAECLRLAKRQEVRPTLTVRVHVPFEFTSQLYHLLQSTEVAHGPEDYDTNGLNMNIQLEPADILGFAQTLKNATRGKGQLEILDSPDNSDNPARDPN